jgi:hypothetical protein
MGRRLGGPQGRFGRRGEETIFTIPGLEFRPLSRPACISTSLSRIILKVFAYSLL